MRRFCSARRTSSAAIDRLTLSMSAASIASWSDCGNQDSGSPGRSMVAVLGALPKIRA